MTIWGNMKVEQIIFFLCVNEFLIKNKIENIQHHIQNIEGNSLKYYKYQTVGMMIKMASISVLQCVGTALKFIQFGIFFLAIQKD